MMTGRSSRSRAAAAVVIQIVILLQIASSHGSGSRGWGPGLQALTSADHQLRSILDQCDKQE